MTLHLPRYLQTGSYSARDDRQFFGQLFNPGVRALGDMGVISTGAPLSVSVAAGHALVPGSSSANQGSYYVFNDATVTISLAAATTFNRFDQIILKVHDTVEGDSTDDGVFLVVRGAESSSATLSNRVGAAALPTNCILLADVLVPVGASAVIPNVNIKTRAKNATPKMSGAPPIGSQLPYAGSAPPTTEAWTLCDGRLIDRSTYDDFYNIVGHAYNGGVDPGSNMVRVPDKRGRVSVGDDGMGGNVGGRLPNSARTRGLNGGAEQVALVPGHLPAHAHSVSDPGHLHGVFPWYNSSQFVINGQVAQPGAQWNIGQMQFTNPAYQYVQAGMTGGAFTGINVGGGGSGNANGNSHNNLQPYEVDLWIVRIA